jgi:hypothetical protein
VDEKPTYEKLLADNRGMNKELRWYHQNTKVNNLLRSLILAIIVCVTIAIIELFAVIGANAFAEKQNLSFFWISTIGAFLDISHWILYGYVIWHIFTVNVYNFYDELESGYNKLKKIIIKERIRIAKKVLEEEKDRPAPSHEE